MYNESKGKASALGRRSTLDLFEGSNVRKKDKKNRRLSKDSKDDEDIDLDEFSENRRMIRDEGEEKVEDSILSERKVGFTEDSISDRITATSLMAGLAGEVACTVESTGRFSSLRDDLPQDEERPRQVLDRMNGTMTASAGQLAAAENGANNKRQAQPAQQPVQQAQPPAATALSTALRGLYERRQMATTGGMQLTADMLEQQIIQLEAESQRQLFAQYNLGYNGGANNNGAGNNGRANNNGAGN